MKKIQHVVYGNDTTAQALDIYLPDECVSYALVYFHSGGWKPVTSV